MFTCYTKDSVHGFMNETIDFLLYNNLFKYQVLCTLIHRRRSLNSFIYTSHKSIILDNAIAVTSPMLKTNSWAKTSEISRISHDFLATMIHIQKSKFGIPETQLDAPNYFPDVLLKKYSSINWCCVWYSATITFPCESAWRSLWFYLVTMATI